MSLHLWRLSQTGLKVRYLEYLSIGLYSIYMEISVHLVCSELCDLTVLYLILKTAPRQCSSPWCDHWLDPVIVLHPSWSFGHVIFIQLEFVHLLCSKNLFQMGWFKSSIGMTRSFCFALPSRLSPAFVLWGILDELTLISRRSCSFAVSSSFCEVIWTSSPWFQGVSVLWLSEARSEWVGIYRIFYL